MGGAALLCVFTNENRFDLNPSKAVASTVTPPCMVQRPLLLPRRLHMLMLQPPCMRHCRRIKPRAHAFHLPFSIYRFDTDRVKGGSSWGAATFAGADNSRQPTDVELGYAQHQASCC